MFEILDKSEGKVIGVRVSGKLLHEDYQQFVPKLEKLIVVHGSIRCYMELGDFAGVELRAIWDEMKFDAKHLKDIERCAIVGDKSWHHWMSNMGKLIFHKASLQYFDVSESAKAWAWIKEDKPKSCCCCGGDSGCDS